jgi:hypothetical protein
MYIGILNMRNTEVTHRIPLEDCGDAKVNVTAYEDCDITHTGNAAYNYAYTTADTGNGAAAYTQDNPGGEYISDYNYGNGIANTGTYSNGATSAAFWQAVTQTYYECDEICMKVEVGTCPDSYESNGED